jgi:HD-GYP domain-containing protein (c-di-GMP phosphodiesterase class II)
MKKILTDKEATFLREIMGLSEIDAEKKATNERDKSLSETGKLYLETVEDLLEAIYKVNSKILEHSFRVAEKCVEIAAELKFNVDEIKAIAFGSLLHDIGIIGIENDLLIRSERKWNKNELAEYYKHTMFGKKIIEPIMSLRRIIPFIEKHHEYLNGTGHPNGLSEQEIPFEVRILTVVNDFDMMSEAFPWGEKYSFDKCIENIKSNAPTLYDSKVVEIFIGLEKRISNN